MRILMLAQCYPPTIGGEERFVHDLSVGLAARGHDISVVTIGSTGVPAYTLEEGVRIFRVPTTMNRIPFLYSSPRRLAPPFPDPEACWAIRKIIRQVRPQIVHAHNWIIHSFLPLKRWSRAGLLLTLNDLSLICVTKKLLHRGSVCSERGPAKCLACAARHYGWVKGIGTSLGNWISGYFERQTVDVFLPVSLPVAVHSGLDCSGLRYRIIPNLLPDNASEAQVCKCPELLHLPGEPYLLFVGAFSRYKGVDVLIQAYAGIPDPPPLVIIGYDSDEYPIETLSFPPKVLIFKNWNHDAVMAAHRRSLMLIVPSVWMEPFGIVAIEAMAAGRPVIASRIGGLADIVVEGETGLLVEPGNPQALRQAINHLLANPQDRERMGEAARQRVVQFQARNLIPQYEQAYQEVSDCLQRAE
jgi:glycosyltransferase involved in cell wall biosynthesis